MNVLQKKGKDYLTLFVMALVFLFPMTATVVRHAPTAIYEVLVLLGLFLYIKRIRHLSRYEIYVFAGFVAMFVVAAMSLINTDDISSGVSRLGKYLLFALSVFAFLTIQHRRERVLSALLWGTVAGSFVIFGVGLYQVLIEQAPRAHGVVHPIMFGSVAALYVGMLLFMLVADELSGLQRVAVILAIMAAGYAMVLSQTRGAMLMMPIYLLILIFYFRGRFSRKFYAVVGVVVFVVAGMLVIKGDTILQNFKRGMADIERYQNDPNYMGSWSARLVMWENAVQLWKKHPVLGIGLGDYNKEMQQLVESGQGVNKNALSYMYTAHSVYFHTLATTGALGLLSCCIAVFIMPFLVVLRYIRLNFSIDKYAAMMLILLVSFAMFGMSTTWIATRGFLSVYLFFFVILFAFISSGMIGNAAKKT